ncbi:hypothetical protein SpCBS45565_g08245 [Spizellomyces sp. 'palustris']|nr:hypothetical protein SpCBS45565_g08245 [Spizellomyces sp. 'palustris']
MPPAVEHIIEPVHALAQNLKAATISSKQNNQSSLQRQPLRTSGVLDKNVHVDLTVNIGREYPSVQIKDLLNAPNADELIRDLAITVSERGVVFFRNQDLTLEQQKILGQKLGELTGKPATSKLHIHPVANADREDGIKVNERGEKDHEISVISSEQGRTVYKSAFGINRNRFGSEQWHSDITFEPIPSDYSILQIKQIPPTGGDTLWASGYEAYDRLSPAYQKFLDGLTATYSQPGFLKAAQENGFELHTAPRGAPENVGGNLEAVHPVVRTNPVTGWKSLFAVGHHVGHVNGVTKYESEKLLKYFNKLVYANHDLQVRFKWNTNDVAIWDNRSAYHAATPDYDASVHKRFGNRVVSLGEKPYFDQASVSRRTALGLQA